MKKEMVSSSADENSKFEFVENKFFLVLLSALMILLLVGFVYAANTETSDSSEKNEKGFLYSFFQNPVKAITKFFQSLFGPRLEPQSACVVNCAGKLCGELSCGVSCLGPCPDPATQECFSKSGGGYECRLRGACTCVGKECGDDGCGGSCGPTCPTNKPNCVSGVCTGGVTPPGTCNCPPNDNPCGTYSCPGGGTNCVFQEKPDGTFCGESYSCEAEIVNITYGGVAQKVYLTKKTCQAGACTLSKTKSVVTDCSNNGLFGDCSYCSDKDKTDSSYCLSNAEDFPKVLETSSTPITCKTPRKNEACSWSKTNPLKNPPENCKNNQMICDANSNCIPNVNCPRCGGTTAAPTCTSSGNGAICSVASDCAITKLTHLACQYDETSKLAMCKEVTGPGKNQCTKATAAVIDSCQDMCANPAKYSNVNAKKESKSGECTCTQCESDADCEYQGASGMILGSCESEICKTKDESGTIETKPCPVEGQVFDPDKGGCKCPKGTDKDSCIPEESQCDFEISEFAGNCPWKNMIPIVIPSNSLENPEGTFEGCKCTVESTFPLLNVETGEDTGSCATYDIITTKLNENGVVVPKDNSFAYLAYTTSYNVGAGLRYISAKCLLGFSMDSAGYCQCLSPRIRIGDSCVCKNGLNTYDCQPVTFKKAANCTTTLNEILTADCGVKFDCKKGQKQNCNCKQETKQTICNPNILGSESCPPPLPENLKSTSSGSTSAPFGNLYGNPPASPLVFECGIHGDGCGAKYIDCGKCDFPLNSPPLMRCDTGNNIVYVLERYCSSDGTRSYVERIASECNSCYECKNPETGGTEINGRTYYEQELSCSMMEEGTKCIGPKDRCNLQHCWKCQKVNEQTSAEKMICAENSYDTACITPRKACVEEVIIQLDENGDELDRQYTGEQFPAEEKKQSDGSYKYVIGERCIGCKGCLSEEASCPVDGSYYDDAIFAGTDYETFRIGEIIIDDNGNKYEILDESETKKFACDKTRSEESPCSAADAKMKRADFCNPNLLGWTSASSMLAQVNELKNPSSTSGVATMKPGFVGAVINAITGKSVFFDTGFDDDYIKSTNKLGISGKMPWSVSALVYPENSPDEENEGGIIAFGSNGYKQGFFLNYKKDTKSFEFGTLGTGLSAETSSAYPAENLYYVVCSYDGANLKLYIDNVLAKTLYVGDLSIVDGELKIGRFPFGGTYYFDGTISDVKAWNYALGESEISQEYLAGDNGLALHLDFNNDTIDSSGNFNDGTNMGKANFIAGRKALALNLNGNTQYVSLPFSESLALNKEITLSAWIKTSSTGKMGILKRGVNGGGFENNDYSLSVNAGRVYFGLGDGTKSDSIASTQTINNNQWHLVTGVLRNNNAMELYIDGNLAISGVKTIMGTNPLSNQQLVGSLKSNALYFNGQIDEVKIWKYGLSASEIKQEYQDGLKGIILYYPFDEDANDFSGNKNNGILTNYPVNDFGNIGYAYNFNGKNTSIDSSKNLGISGTMPWTVSTWVYPSKRTSINTGGGIIAFGVQTNKNGFFLNYKSNTNVFRFGAVGTGFSADTSSIYPAENWYHVVCSFDGIGNLRVYINNVLAKTLNVGTLSISDSKLTIGKFSYQGNVYFNGTIDEVKMWDYALNEMEISQEYQRGIGNGLALYYPFDADAEDYSGFENNGINIKEADFVPGRKALALDLNGNNQYVDVPFSQSLALGNEITLSAWIKTSSTGKMGILKRGVNGGNFENNDYSLSMNFGKVYFGLGNGTKFDVLNSKNTFKDNQWHLVTGVLRNNNAMELYVDGNLVNSSVKTIPGTNPLSNQQLVGSFKSNSLYFNGQIDEVKIWQYALTGKEIQQEYFKGQMGLLIDYPLKSDYDYYDMSGNLNDGNLEEPFLWGIFGF
jgi:hypothetical protein